MAAPSAMAKLVLARSPNISTSLIWQVHESAPVEVAPMPIPTALNPSFVVVGVLALPSE